jgi:hypothetical protein
VGAFLWFFRSSLNIEKEMSYRESAASTLIKLKCQKPDKLDMPEN